METEEKKSEEKIVFFKDFKRKVFVKKIKDFFRDHIIAPILEFVQWCADNPKTAAILAALTAGVLKKGFQYKKSKMEDRRRACDFYDHRTGKWVSAKRKPTKRQLEVIEERYMNNKRETYRHILDDMGLL